MTKAKTPAEERRNLKARLLMGTKARHAKRRKEPGYAEGYAAWEQEYNATVAMHKARKAANLTQDELARRMNIPRANVSRIENGQNVTIATLARYLRSCGFAFSLNIHPLQQA